MDIQTLSCRLERSNANTPKEELATLTVGNPQLDNSDPTILPSKGTDPIDVMKPECLLWTCEAYQVCLGDVKPKQEAGRCLVAP